MNRISRLVCVASATLFLEGFSYCTREDRPQNIVRDEIWTISHRTEMYNASFSPEKRECLVVTPETHSSDSSPFHVLRGAIAGFDYEPGYRYRLLVTVTCLANPPQDDGNPTYALKRIISKEKV